VPHRVAVNATIGIPAASAARNTAVADHPSLTPLAQQIERTICIEQLRRFVRRRDIFGEEDVDRLDTEAAAGGPTHPLEPLPIPRA
jgi:hypothetical protein